MHACGHGRRRLVAPTARRKPLHWRGMHAGSTHKLDDSGKHTVYAVQFFASLPYMQSLN